MMLWEVGGSWGSDRHNIFGRSDPNAPNDTGRQRRAAEMGTGTDAAYDRSLESTTAKMEGEVDRRLQQLTEAAGAFLSPAEIEDALKAAGWSAAERADTLRGQGLRYR